ncbi:hypothetical protein [Solwaraspora sp. WMMA2065]|uniref:hypothetical protein n=1 Tax=Solwaraspora sp. WMMA2065 TaxID=3015166 RepID=UPI00259B0268|nr:hypothetical protein [Solwaraspora sp. WMMA2065]WJK33090.1 hypothetical protein O7610_20530 [Solwaraspora sp. WMMA2065]
MRRRLSDPGQDDGIGQSNDTLTSAYAGYHTFVATWRRLGATTIDAKQDPDEVCQELLMAAAFVAMRRQAST